MSSSTNHKPALENLLKHHFPLLSSLPNKLNFFIPRPSPRSNHYVITSSAVPSTETETYSLLSHLQSSSSKLPQTQIAAEIMDHLVAGIDTVGDALCFIIYALSSPAQLLIQEHLISSLSSREKENEKEEYLEAIIHEGLRLYSPIPMSQPRLVPPSGKTIDGYWIPGGMVVGSQGWSVHRLNADVWGEEEEVFKPERWLADGNKNQDEDEDERRKQMERALFAFGRGGRGCTGKVYVGFYSSPFALSLSLLRLN